MSLTKAATLLPTPAGLLAAIWLWDWRWALTGLVLGIVAALLTGRTTQQKDMTTRTPLSQPDNMTSRTGDPMEVPELPGPFGPSPFGGGRG